MDRMGKSDESTANVAMYRGFPVIVCEVRPGVWKGPYETGGRLVSTIECGSSEYALALTRRHVDLHLETHVPESQRPPMPERPTVPLPEGVDGYAVRHLAHHFHAAGRVQEAERWGEFLEEHCPDCKFKVHVVEKPCTSVPQGLTPTTAAERELSEIEDREGAEQQSPPIGTYPWERGTPLEFSLRIREIFREVDELNKHCGMPQKGMTMDPITRQASEILAWIEQWFPGKSPLYYVSNKNGGPSLPILLEYNSPKRPGQQLNGRPKDWMYEVMALTKIPHPRVFIQAEAICRPPDVPSRGLGRTIALMRLAGVLRPMGWRVWAGRNGVELEIPSLLEE
jgi:hypothetical protein